MKRIIDITSGQLAVAAALGLMALVWAGRPLLPAVATAPPAETWPVPGAPGGVYRGVIALNPNSAPADSLELVPGLGPTLVEALVATRRHTPFYTLDDLLLVPGLGPDRLRTLQPFLTVDL